ncbi:MAG: DUF2125 domain-containing protein [Paracoccaceae bacterium]|nr:DUF2125 domain-containing protein [Paracoccaceae bacterium]
MTRLIVVLLVGTLAWMTWWALGKSAYEQGLSAWIDERRAVGWAADVGSMETGGFPNRFDTTITDLRLADPRTGVAWSSPFVQLLSLAYKPHQVIAVVADEHRFSTPLETFDIVHEDARASLFLKPETALGLNSARLTVTQLGLTSTLGWRASLDDGQFAVESVPAAENTYRVGVNVDQLRPADATRRTLDPAGVLPEVIDNMHLDAILAFDRPWDRFAIEERRPQPTRIDLTNLSAEWGTVTFRAAGEVDVDAEGYPNGEITVRAVEWRKLVAMAVSSGVLPVEAAGPLERALELMTSGRDTLDATLGLRGGMVRLGVIPIAPAPRLVIR